ncbi:NUDIX hydrolase [Jatrophihabitans sp. DSM 45814]
MGSGDGWTVCLFGHRHWGLYGAAGLLIVDGDRVVLQHRAPWTHEGGSWGIPGGARDAGETPVQAALREANEEAGLDPDDIEPIGLYIADHGTWSYTTVVARPRRPIYPMAVNAESVSVEWVPTAEVDTLLLHGGFASAWPQLQQVPDPVRLLLGPDTADDEAMAYLDEHGLAASQLPPGLTAGSLHRLLVQAERVNDSEQASALAADTPEGLQILVVLDPEVLISLR